MGVTRGKGDGGLGRGGRARPSEATRLRCSRSCRFAWTSGDWPGGGWKLGRRPGLSRGARYPWGQGQDSDPRVAGQRPSKIPETAHAPAPEAESMAPTPRRLVTPPEQHARDGEVGEAADAPRHQLQLRFGHGRVQERGREEVGSGGPGSRQSGEQGRGVLDGRGRQWEAWPL